MRNIPTFLISTKIFAKHILLTFCFLAYLLNAVVEAQLTVLEPTEFNENWENEIPVSGGVLKGIAASDPGTGIDPKTLTIWMPRIQNNFLYVSICSRDGRYTAEIKYEIAKINAGEYRLRIPTDYTSKLSNYRAKDLSVLAIIGSESDQDNTLFIPVHWKSSPKPTNKFFDSKTIKLYNIC